MPTSTPSGTAGLSSSQPISIPSTTASQETVFPISPTPAVPAMDPLSQTDVSRLSDADFVRALQEGGGLASQPRSDHDNPPPLDSQGGKSDSTTTSSHLHADDEMDVSDEHFINDDSQPAPEPSQGSQQTLTLAAEIEAMDQSVIIHGPRTSRYTGTYGPEHGESDATEDDVPTTQDSTSLGIVTNGPAASTHPVEVTTPTSRSATETAVALPAHTLAFSNPASRPASRAASRPASIHGSDPDATIFAAPAAGPDRADGGQVVFETIQVTDTPDHPRLDGRLVFDAAKSSTSIPVGTLRYTLPRWWKGSDDDQYRWALDELDRVISAAQKARNLPGNFTIDIPRAGPHFRNRNCDVVFTSPRTQVAIQTLHLQLAPFGEIDDTTLSPPKPGLPINIRYLPARLAVEGVTPEAAAHLAAESFTGKSIYIIEAWARYHTRAGRKHFYNEIALLLFIPPSPADPGGWSRPLSPQDLTKVPGFCGPASSAGYQLSFPGRPPWCWGCKAKATFFHLTLDCNNRNAPCGLCNKSGHLPRFCSKAPTQTLEDDMPFSYLSPGGHKPLPKAPAPPPTLRDELANAENLHDVLSAPTTGPAPSSGLMGPPSLPSRPPLRTPPSQTGPLVDTTHAEVAAPGPVTNPTFDFHAHRSSPTHIRGRGRGRPYDRSSGPAPRGKTHSRQSSRHSSTSSRPDEPTRSTPSSPSRGHRQALISEYTAPPGSPTKRKRVASDRPTNP